MENSTNNQMNAERLLKLAEHLETGKLGHEKFDFSYYNASDELGAAHLSPNCGAVGCAIGECPIVFPDEWRFNDQGFPVTGLHFNSTDSGKEFFRLSEEEYEHLFLPHHQDYDRFGGVDLNDHATKELVAANIRAFVALRKGAA
jgi:hypothetical protein